MRAQLAFWKNRTWRMHLARCLRSVNANVDFEALKPAPPSMAKWRYETYAAVMKYLKTVRDIAQNHARREMFSNTQERATVHDF